MKPRVLSFSIAIVMTFIVLCSCHNKNMGNTDKTLFTHQIVNPVLKEQIQQFDDRYGDHPVAKGRGISLLFMNYSDSTHFWIGYSAGINNTTPLIVCEPINNKPVILHIHDLYDFMSLPMKNAVELQKESSPKEYEMHINAMSDTIIINGEKSTEQIIVMDDFVNWIVKFDKNGKFVGIDTAGFE